MLPSVSHRHVSLLVLSPSCLGRLWPPFHLSPRIGGCFSGYCLAYRTPPCHSRLLSSSPPLKISRPPSQIYILLLILSDFHFLLLSHTGTSVHLLVPSPGYGYTSCFFLAGQGRPYTKSQDQRFRGVHWRVNTQSFLSLLSTPPPVYLASGVSPLSPHFLALAFPFFLPFLHVLNFFMGSR